MKLGQKKRIFVLFIMHAVLNAIIGFGEMDISYATKRGWGFRVEVGGGLDDGREYRNIEMYFANCSHN